VKKAKEFQPILSEKMVIFSAPKKNQTMKHPAAPISLIAPPVYIVDGRDSTFVVCRMLGGRRRSYNVK
jgi:hypothetical protein